VQPAALESLGAWVWPVPGAIAERHFYFCVDVGALPRRTPTEDGSPLERHAAIVKLPVSEILSFCRDGQIRDAKTELALRRFAERARWALRVAKAEERVARADRASRCSRSGRRTARSFSRAASLA
jgi:hypothetical protein